MPQVLRSPRTLLPALMVLTNSLQKALPWGMQCWRGEGRGRDEGKLSKGVYGSVRAPLHLWCRCGAVWAVFCLTSQAPLVPHCSWEQWGILFGLSAYGSTLLSDTKYVARGVCLWSHNRVERTKLHLQGHTGTSWWLDPIFGLFVGLLGRKGKFCLMHINK